MRCRILVFLILIPFSGYGQSFPYSRYSVKEGLPHSNVYAIAQDSLGYMWFGTESGLTRFDGTSFVSLFSSNADLASGPVTTLQFSNNGVLYAGTGSNRVYKIDDSEISSVRGTGESMLSVSSLGVQKNSVIIFHEFIHTEVVPEPGTSNDESVNKIEINKSVVPFCSKTLRNGTLLVGTGDGLYKVVDGVESPCKYEGYHGDPVYTIFEDTNGEIYLGSVGKIIKVKNAKVTEVINVGFSEKQNIKVLLCDDYGNLWINFWGDDNLFVLTPGQNAINLFENSGIRRGIVSKLFKDKSGNVWLSVLGDGVYRFSNLLLKNNASDVFGQGTLLTCMDATPEDYVIFGTYNGLLFLKRSSGAFYRVKLSQGLLEYVRDIRVTESEVYAGITDMRLDSILLKEQKLVVDIDTFNIHYKHASSIQQVESDLYLGNWDNEIGIENAETGIEKGELVNLFKSYESLRINCLYYGTDKKLYIGSQGGLVVADLKRGVKYSLHNRVLNGSINRITSGSRPGDMIVYAETGVCQFHNGKIVSLIETADNNKITAICETETGTRFIGTNNGLYYYSSKDSAHFDFASGLPANEVNDLYYDRPHQLLYILTHSGYSVINTSQLKNYKIAQHRLLVNCIETDSQKIYFSGSISLPYTENLKLLNLSTLNPSGVHFKYIKLDVDGKTYYTASYKFDLSELSPGKNIVTMRYVYDDGIEGPATTVVIKLIPPFYRTSWFYLLAGLSGTGFTLLGFRKQKNRRDKKQLERSRVAYKINLLKQQALVANLNPHFIFNALNAIQSFVNSNNLESANEYLTLFSKLMRQHLNSAGKDLIPIQEELDRLKNYLEIEQLRFGDKLEYEIFVDEKIRSTDVAIPNMIIQPFIENAIWHGFKGMQRSGRITLSIHMNSEDILQIEIADNGRGIGEAKSGNQNSKDPRGISLIRERLELLNDHSEKVLFFGSLNPDSEYPGTVVTIKLSPRMYRIAHSFSRSQA